MKKLLLLLAVLGIAQLSLSASEITGVAEYTGSSEFNQIRAKGLVQFGLNWSAGIIGKYAREDAFKEPVYAVKLPIDFSSELVSFNVAPFYYFKNKSDNKEYQAFGISGKLIMTLEEDAINELYSHAYVGAAFSRQRGELWRDDINKDQYYSQTAYTLGLHKNFFRAFSFEGIGTVFQYPDGITGVQAFRGILDQQDLVFLQSYDIVHALPKYTVGGRLTRLWADRRATLYLSYRFGEFYTADPDHSFVVGNTFALTQWAMCDVAYNHLRAVHDTNKRDIFYAQIRFVF